MRKVPFGLFTFILLLSSVSCGDGNKDNSIQQSTEIAKRRTDSLNRVQKDSLERKRLLDIQREDSIHRADSLRKVYEKHHFTLYGDTGETPVTLSVNRSDSSSHASGDFACEGSKIHVEGTYEKTLSMKGTGTWNGKSSVHVSINLKEKDDEFHGTVNYSHDGETTSHETTMYKY